MNRKHTRDDYFELIEKFRAIRPNLAFFLPDFIVGYPGETEEDFQQTMDLIKHELCTSILFKYSPRPGTPASILRTRLQKKKKMQDCKSYKKLLIQQQTTFNQSKIGSILSSIARKIRKI